MKSLINAIDALNDFVGEIISWICVLCAFSVTLEVVMRYAFNAPTLWSMEFNQFLFGLMSMLGGGYCLLRDGHVRVDIFYPKFFPRTKAIIELTIYTLTILLCVTLIVMGGSEFWSSLIFNRKTDSVLGFPLWLLWVGVPLGGMLLLLQVVAIYLKHIRTLIGMN